LTSAFQKSEGERTGLAKPQTAASLLLVIHGAGQASEAVISTLNVLSCHFCACPKMFFLHFFYVLSLFNMENFIHLQ
jgi:hypothetical protein